VQSQALNPEIVFLSITFLTAQFLHDVFDVDVPDYLFRLKILNSGVAEDLHDFYRQRLDEENNLQWLSATRMRFLQCLDEKALNEVYQRYLKEIVPLLGKASDNDDFLAGEIMRGNPLDARIRAAVQQVAGKKPTKVQDRLLQKMLEKFAGAEEEMLSSDDPEWRAMCDDIHDAIAGGILAVPEALQEMGEEERGGKYAWDTAGTMWSEAWRRAREKARWQQRKTKEKEKPSEDIDQYVQVSVIFGGKRQRKKSPYEAMDAENKEEIIWGSSVLRQEGG
jgi:hypothetical protein